MVDSAVFKRNIDICERFNIVIDEPLVGDGNESVIRMAVKAGSSEFDVYGGYQYYSIVLGSEGSLSTSATRTVSRISTLNANTGAPTTS